MNFNIRYFTVSRVLINTGMVFSNKNNQTKYLQIRNNSSDSKGGSNNANNPLLMASNLFITNNTSSSIICRLPKFNFKNFKSFCKVFTRMFPTRTNSGNHNNMLYGLLRIYISLYLINNSSFLFALFQGQRIIKTCDFFMNYINSVCLKIVSNNKIIGVTEGSIETESNYQEIINLCISDLHHVNLTDLNYGEIIGAFVELQIAGPMDSKKIHELKESLVSNLRALQNLEKKLSSQDYAIEMAINPLSNFLTFILNRDNFRLMDYNILFSHTEHLGIYRFRFHSPENYVLNQNLVKNVNIRVFENFCSFLSIFEPKFYSNNELLPNVILGQEVLISVNSSLNELAYENLFSVLGIRDINSSPTNKRKRYKSTDNTSAETFSATPQKHLSSNSIVPSTVVPTTDAQPSNARKYSTGYGISNIHQNNDISNVLSQYQCENGTKYTFYSTSRVPIRLTYRITTF